MADLVVYNNNNGFNQKPDNLTEYKNFKLKSF